MACRGSPVKQGKLGIAFVDEFLYTLNCHLSFVSEMGDAPCQDAFEPAPRLTGRAFAFQAFV
jgi:hypothetical protein